MSLSPTSPSPLSPINALSPLDGRYASKLANLRPLMSEQGYMHRRVQVELEIELLLDHHDTHLADVGTGE